MNCTSFFKLTPGKGDLFLLLVLLFFVIKTKQNNEYISGTLFVCWSSMVECTCGQIEILI